MGPGLAVGTAEQTTEGTHCPLAARGYNRDGKTGKEQINYGLILDPEGRPVAVQVYPGNTADPKTVADQAHKLKQQYHLAHVVLVGDRGMLTRARIDDLREKGGIDWISALRNQDIQALAGAGAVSRSMFDEQDLVEITSPDYPGERLILCRNPFLAEERARKRRELLAATELGLALLAKRVAAGRLKQAAKIGQALGRALNRFKVGKHFACTVDAGRFAYQRREDSIARESSLDGIYVVRTSLPAAALASEQTVSTYKSLQHAEQAFRNLKSVDIPHPPASPLDRAPRPRPHLPVHARLLPPVAPPAGVGALPLRGRSPRSPPGRLRRATRLALRGRSGRGPHQAHPRRRGGA